MLPNLNFECEYVFFFFKLFITLAAEFAVEFVFHYVCLQMDGIVLDVYNKSILHVHTNMSEHIHWTNIQCDKIKAES